MNIVFGRPFPDEASSDTLKPTVLLPSGCTSWFSFVPSTAWKHRVPEGKSQRQHRPADHCGAHTQDLEVCHQVAPETACCEVILCGA